MTAIEQRHTVDEHLRASRNSLDQLALDETDEDSFPASDPPAWTSTHAGSPVRERDTSAPLTTNEVD
jgi:hypothetical protein